MACGLHLDVSVKLYWLSQDISDKHSQSAWHQLKPKSYNALALTHWHVCSCSGCIAARNSKALTCGRKHQYVPCKSDREALSALHQTYWSCTSTACLTFAGAELQLGNSRWLDLDRGIVTSTPKIHAAIMKAINQGSNSQS